MSPAVQEAAAASDTRSYDPAQYRPGRTITDWEPENELFWRSTGKRVATRNLWIAVPALLVAFVVWQVWSVTATKLSDVGFGFSTSQLFWLTAIPGLTGGTGRILYTFLGPKTGQRTFTALSTVVLIAPLIWLGYAVQDTSTSFAEMATIAALCGIGGANFSSSLANIGFFFPKRLKGSATGINGGLGNLGVSVIQLLTPIVITSSVLAIGSGQHNARTGGEVYLQNAAFLWVPVLIVLALVAWFGQNNLKTASTSFSQQKVIFRRKHNWLMTWLYVGTFGSFIGFAAALPMLIKTTFPAYSVATYAWMGPALGALARWAGGWIADKLGGARVTILSFVGMAAAIVGVISFLPSGSDSGSFYGFFACFLAAFFFSGIGNGSTFRQIPVIFRDMHLKRVAGQGAEAEGVALRQAEMEAGAVTGFSAAIAAYGFFFIPAMFASMAVIGSLWLFVGFYATCLAVCWWFYARKGAEAPS